MAEAAQRLLQSSGAAAAAAGGVIRWEGPRAQAPGRKRATAVRRGPGSARKDK